MASEDIALLGKDQADEDKDDETSYLDDTCDHDRHPPSRIRTFPVERSNHGHVSVQPSICAATQSNGNGKDDVQPPAQDYFFLSLFTTLCCLPLGLVALVLSVKANRLFEAGDEEQGHQTALISLAINTVAIVCGILIIGVLLILFVFT